MGTNAGKRMITGKKMMAWKRIMMLVAVIMLLFVITACKSGNQVTGSSAFVENPADLPSAQTTWNTSLPTDPLAEHFSANWITGSAG